VRESASSFSAPWRHLPIVHASGSGFPAPWRQLPIVRASAFDLGLGVNLCTSPPLRPPLTLPRSLASSSHCSDGHSVLLSATPSAPSPQSDVTGNEVWRGLRARRLSPWTVRAVLDAPATKSFRP